jgi:hypothetical protein
VLVGVAAAAAASGAVTAAAAVVAAAAAAAAAVAVVLLLLLLLLLLLRHTEACLGNTYRLGMQRSLWHSCCGTICISCKWGCADLILRYLVC